MVDSDLDDSVNSDNSDELGDSSSYEDDGSDGCLSSYDDDDILQNKQIKMRRQIENDDPELNKLTIGYSHIYHPNDNDWERDGKAIGRNTQIKEIDFSRDMYGIAVIKGFCSFLQGLCLQ